MDYHSIKKIITILIGFISIVCNSQDETIAGHVIDSETLSPLPYVNIMVINHLSGTSTNEKGMFILNVLNIKKSNKVVFSNLGYENLIVSIDSLSKLDTIYLKPLAIALNEVIISKKNKRKYKTINLNKIKKGRSTLVYSTKAFEKGESLWVPYRASEPTIEAMFFLNEYAQASSEVVLDRIEMYLSSFSDTSIFRIRIYDVGSNNSPRQDIIELPVQIMQKGTRIVEVDLSSYDIEMPEKGLFIGLELIMADTNFSSFVNKEGYTAKIQSPFLLYKLQRDFYSFYRYSKGKWNSVEQQFRYSEEMPIKYCKPAINLVVRKYK